jgi:hypothetical protein
LPACAGWPAGLPYQALPATFIPVTALRCITGTKDIPGQGPYFAATLERSDGDLRALAAALRQPSGHVQKGIVCPAIAMLAPQVVLIGKDGSMIRPKFPVNGCGMIQSQALRTLNALPWHAVSVRVFSQVPGGTGTPGRATPPPSGPAMTGMNKPGPGGPAH